MKNDWELNIFDFKDAISGTCGWGNLSCGLGCRLVVREMPAVIVGMRRWHV
jgi:hypothetical protein